MAWLLSIPPPLLGCGLSSLFQFFDHAEPFPALGLSLDIPSERCHPKRTKVVCAFYSHICHFISTISNKVNILFASLLSYLHNMNSMLQGFC